MSSGARRRRSTRAVMLVAAGLLSAACAKPTPDDLVLLSGRIEAPTVDLAPRITGRVVEVLVREGDRVESGALLVRLDLGTTGLAVDRERAGLAAAESRLRDLEQGSRRPEIAAAEAQVADRQAQVDLAEAGSRRQTAMLARGVGSQRDHEKATADVEQAKAALEGAGEQLALLRQGSRKWQAEQARDEVERARVVLRQAETDAAEGELRSPADAVVLHRIAEPGLLLAPGQSALTLAFRERLYVRVFIPETELGRVQPGAVARVSVDAFPGKTFPGKVTEISPDAEFTPKPVDTRDLRVSFVYPAKVELDHGWQEPLVPGQPADVTIEVGARDPT